MNAISSFPCPRGLTLLFCLCPAGGFAAFSSCFPGLCEGKPTTILPMSLSQPCLPVANVGPTRILPHLYLGSQKDVLNKVRGDLDKPLWELCLACLPSQNIPCVINHLQLVLLCSLLFRHMQLVAMKEFSQCMTALLHTFWVYNCCVISH